MTVYDITYIKHSVLKIVALSCFQESLESFGKTLFMERFIAVLCKRHSIP